MFVCLFVRLLLSLLTSALDFVVCCVCRCLFFSHPFFFSRATGSCSVRGRALSAACACDSDVISSFSVAFFGHHFCAFPPPHHRLTSPAAATALFLIDDVMWCGLYIVDANVVCFFHDHSSWVIIGITKHLSFFLPCFVVIIIFYSFRCSHHPPPHHLSK